MANKRIKISELPKIGYNQTGPQSTTKNDYLPIAVTNKTDLTVKTTMAITTRELQRFVLQQSENLADETNTLTIGRSNAGEAFTVKIDNLQIDTQLKVTGDCIFDGNVNMASITLDTGNFTEDIRVGSSTYPSIFRNQAKTAVIPYGLLVANAQGKLDGHSTSLAGLIGLSPATIPAYAGRVVTVGLDGKLSFSYQVDTLLQDEESLTSNPDYYGNVVGVSNNGGLNPNTGVSIAAIKAAVTATGQVIADEDDVTSVNHRFVTTTTNTPTVGDLKFHDSVDLNIKTVNDTVTTAKGPFQNSTAGGKILVTRSGSPGLSDVEVADTKHMKLVTNVTSSSDAVDFNDNDTARGKNRVVFGSPIVLAGKHEDDVDLTDYKTNYAAQFKRGPRDFPAQIGEIRWNMYNGVPTIYLATSKMGSEVNPFVKVPNACHWYGIPLFGTLDLDASTDPLTADNSALDNHSYENLD